MLGKRMHQGAQSVLAGCDFLCPFRNFLYHLVLFDGTQYIVSYLKGSCGLEEQVLGLWIKKTGGKGELGGVQLIMPVVFGKLFSLFSDL